MLETRAVSIGIGCQCLAIAIPAVVFWAILKSRALLLLIPLQALVTTSNITWFLVPCSPFLIGALTVVLSRKTWVQNLLATTFFSQLTMGILVLMTGHVYEEAGLRESIGPYAYEERLGIFTVLAAVLSVLGGLIARGLVRMTRAAP